MGFETDLMVQAMQMIRDCTDASGGAKMPRMMLENCRRWEKRGLIEMHHGNAPGVVIARITPKGRAVAAGKLKRGTT